MIRSYLSYRFFPVCICLFLNGAPLFAQESTGSPADAVSSLIPFVAFLLVVYGSLFGLARLYEAVFEKPLETVTPGGGGAEQDRQAAEKLASLTRFQSKVDGQTILFRTRSEAKNVRRTLLEIAALAPGAGNVVEQTNKTILFYNALTRREFSGSRFVFIFSLLLFAFFCLIDVFLSVNGHGPVAIIGLCFAIPGLGYWGVTRSPLYHLVQGNTRIGRNVHDTLAGYFQYVQEHHGKIESITEYRDAYSGKLHHKTTHRVGDELGCVLMIFSFGTVFILPYLTFFNFFRNYIAHWYNG